jgi:hypothetical protein
MFADQLTEIATSFAELGGLALGILAGLLLVFIIGKFIQRHLFLSSLRTRILKPREVNEKLDSGEKPYIIDLRHKHDFDALPYVIPNSVRIPMEHIDEHHEHIPRDRDIVLYCS